MVFIDMRNLIVQCKWETKWYNLNCIFVWICSYHTHSFLINHLLVWPVHSKGTTSLYTLRNGLDLPLGLVPSCFYPHHPTRFFLKVHQNIFELTSQTCKTSLSEPTSQSTTIFGWLQYHSQFTAYLLRTKQPMTPWIYGGNSMKILFSDVGQATPAFWSFS